MTPAEHHKALRKAKQALKRRLAVPCPHCAAMPVGPPPRMLLPQEMCKTHGYRDPRPRRPEDDYRKSQRRRNAVRWTAGLGCGRRGKMVDFTKNKKGDVVAVHCCDSCARAAGLTPKTPADSGKASWFCEVCGHHGIGSLTDCEIGDWLRLRPMQPNAKLSGAEGVRS